ncbi:MAG: TetR/AcrR family transcriptional regulator [Bauldia sp.]|nr:TetR/AcrR family transcriptional regulator [Bauldia sp.]
MVDDEALARPAAPRRRMSAEDRRVEIVKIAVSEFAARGFEGTATEAIAARAGVSQPYLFQLFGNKRELFIATIREAFSRTWRAFEMAANEARAVDPSAYSILHAMGAAYCDLLADRELLRCQLHAYAASADDEIRAAVRREFSDLYRRVAEVSGAPADILDEWFARGMLMNTIAAIAPDLTHAGEDLSLRDLGPVEGRPVEGSRHEDVSTQAPSPRRRPGSSATG